eukprot:scaffold67489_cov57-Attheya_sp.AAC.1
MSRLTENYSRGTITSTTEITPQRSVERMICPTRRTSVIRIVPIYFNASVISVLYPMYAPNAGECREMYRRGGLDEEGGCLTRQWIVT